MSTGSFCISIDVEQAWGIWDRPDEGYHQRCAQAEGPIVDGLISLFERFDICATWAIVGRLLELDDRAAGATRHGKQIWYAPEIINRVRAAKVAQDIGSHSYAHVYFGGVSREAAVEDLEAAKRVHEQNRLSFTSFVFPRNQVAHIDVLRSVGVKVFRSVDQGWHMQLRRRLGTTAGRLANLADKALPLTPATVRPIDRDGIVELPSSMLLMGRNGLRRAVHPTVVVAKATLGLEAAARRGETFHLWFHPSNFYWDTERQLETLGRILSAARDMREQGRLDVRPMSSYARAA
jgi:hypothetical protein